MRRVLVLGIVLALAAGAAPALAASKTTVALSQSGKARAGEPAPWLAGWTLANETFNLSKAFKDPSVARVALVFFATWCAPCKAGILKLTAASKDLQAAGVRLVLVNFQDKTEDVRRYLEGNGLAAEVLLDPFGRTRDVFLDPSGDKVELPRTVLVGRDGKVQAIFGEEGDDYVDRVRAGK